MKKGIRDKGRQDGDKGKRKRGERKHFTLSHTPRRRVGKAILYNAITDQENVISKLAPSCFCLSQSPELFPNA